MIIVNGFQPLTIITKRSILDVAAALDPPLVVSSSISRPRMLRGGSRTAATSKMECFVIIVNGFQPFTIITKRSILDVAAVLDPPLMLRLLFHNRQAAGMSIFKVSLKLQRYWYCYR